MNNKSLLKLWLYQIKRGNWEPSKYSVICSEHFTEDCFVVKGLQNSRRTLKSDAYPTIFSMAIYSEPPKKKTFPARKSADVLMNDDSKEENAPENEDTKGENVSKEENSKEEKMSVDEETKEDNELENEEKNTPVDTKEETSEVDEIASEPKSSSVEI